MTIYTSKKLLKKVIKLKKEIKELKKHKLITQNIIKKKNIAIEKLNINLESQKIINKQKIELVSHLAHEFKTPLNAIIGFVNLLEESLALNEKQKKYCENILSAANHLLHLSNYAIDMSRMETDKLELSYSEFYPHEIIEEVQSILEAEITKKHLFVKTKLSKTIIEADKRRFKQLIYNLVGNAIKYNKLGGSILIKTFIYKKKFYFCIQDTGIGIQEESKKKIFEFLSNIPNSSLKNAESRGIGLSLCKKIISLHNGEINFCSKPNIGTKFWFFIPLEKISTKLSQNISEQN